MTTDFTSTITITELLTNLARARAINPTSIRCRMTTSALRSRGLSDTDIETGLAELAAAE